MAHSPPEEQCDTCYEQAVTLIRVRGMDHELRARTSVWQQLCALHRKEVNDIVTHERSLPWLVFPVRATPIQPDLSKHAEMVAGDDTVMLKLAGTAVCGVVWDAEVDSDPCVVVWDDDGETVKAFTFDEHLPLTKMKVELAHSERESDG